jgi:glycosyltransferase involved in cell wall biosynthesis
MNLVADMLVDHLQKDHSNFVSTLKICPPMRRRFTGVDTNFGQLYNFDRLLNRFWDYPRLIKGRRSDFDLFHILDHSYAHLLHYLPAERVIVTCHDLDTFRSVLDPHQEPRSAIFRKMTERILNGLRQAARVTCDSVATREQLMKYQLVVPERAVVVSNGVHPSCTVEPDDAADVEAARLLGEISDQAIDLLHVGSTIQRKRVDVLLQVFAKVRDEFPQARLIRVGGQFTALQSELVKRLNLDRAVVVLPFLKRNILAAVYRRATLVLQPSEKEGFGLPVAEAMACGTPVVASDLPVLREVGGDAARYCPVAAIDTWSSSVVELLNERRQQPERWTARSARGLVQATKFSWAEYANRMVDLYREVLS